MSNSRSILIIGGSSYIGTHLALRLRDEYKVYATYFSHPIRIPGVTTIPFDVVNSGWIKRVIFATVPDVIYYIAGSNNVEFLESNQKDAEKMHTSGSANVANLAEVVQPRFIFLSNCYTFDGHRGNYHETDIVLPATVLGKAKLGGENFVKGRCLNHVIVRSSPVFGRGNGKHLSTLDYWRMKLAREQRIEVSHMEYHSFAPVHGLVDLLAKLSDSGPRNKVIHYGGITKVSEYELARNFAREFGYNPDLVLQKKYAGQETSVAQQDGPLWDYSLNSTYATDALKVKPYTLEEGFEVLREKSSSIGL